MSQPPEKHEATAASETAKTPDPSVNARPRALTARARSVAAASEAMASAGPSLTLDGPTRVMQLRPSMVASARALVPMPVGMDWTLFAAVMALTAFGVVMAFSASIFTAVHTQSGDESFFLIRHATYAGLGLCVMMVAAHVPYQAWRELAYPVLGVTILALIAVLFVGETRNRATRWLMVGGISLQPAEIAKLAFIIYLARSLSQKAETNAIQTFHIGLLPHMLVWGGLLFLCMKQPDLGTGLVLAVLLFSMTFVAGARIAYLLFFGFGGVAGLVMFLLHDPMRSKRITAFLEPLQHRAATGYQLFNGKLAIATGGYFGNGLGASRQKLGFIPEAHTDFVLSIVGEELGVIGFSVVAVLFAVLLLRGLRIAMHARCEFGRLLALGITLLIGAQAAVNFGVVLGLLPTKGLTLPFVSYGGSSLVVMSMAIGILLNVGRGGRAEFRLPPLMIRRRSSRAMPAQVPSGGIT